MHLLQSWFLLWVFLLEVPTGVVADRYGKKASMVLGTTLGALGLFIFAQFPSFSLFLFAEFLLALSAALISGAHEAFLYDILVTGKIESQSKAIFGRSHSIQMVGAIIAAPIGGLVAANTSLNIPFIMDAVALTLALFVTLAFPSTSKIYKKNGTDHYWKIATDGFIFIKNHALLRLVTIQMATLGIAGYFVIWMYQPLLKSVGVPLEHFGWFNSLLFGAQILIASNFKLVERLFPSLQKYLIFNFFVVTLSFLVVVVAPSLLSILLFMGVGGGFALTQGKYTTAHINEWIPTSQRATILSFMNMLQKTFLIILNPFIGFAIDNSLKMALSLILAFIVCIFGTVSVFGVLNSRKNMQLNNYGS